MNQDESEKTLDESGQTLDKPEKVLDVPEKTLDESGQTLDKPEKVLDEPEKTRDESEQTSDEPEKVLDEPEKVMDEPEKVMDEPEMASDESEEDKEEDKNEYLGRIAQLVRTLHGSLKELGLEDSFQEAAESIPDAKDRLAYIAKMTEEAALKTLNAVDKAQPVQQEIADDAQVLSKRWSEHFSLDVGEKEVKSLALDTCGFLNDVQSRSEVVNKELVAIIMAQDFQDLTGQVIRKLIDLIGNLEQNLLAVIVDGACTPEEKEALHQRLAQKQNSASLDDAALLNGPQIDPEVEGVVGNQDEVDDLLSELGF